MSSRHMMSHGGSGSTSQFSVEALRSPNGSRQQEWEQQHRQDQTELLEVMETATLPYSCSPSNHPSSTASDKVVTLPPLPMQFLSPSPPLQRPTSHRFTTTLSMHAPALVPAPQILTSQQQQQNQKRKGVLSFKERQRLRAQGERDDKPVKADTKLVSSGYRPQFVRGTISFTSKSNGAKNSEKDKMDGDGNGELLRSDANNSAGGNVSGDPRTVMSSPATPLYIRNPVTGLSFKDSQRLGKTGFRPLPAGSIPRKKGIPSTTVDGVQSLEAQHTDPLVSTVRSASAGVTGQRERTHSVDISGGLFDLPSSSSWPPSNSSSSVGLIPGTRDHMPERSRHSLLHGIEREGQQQQQQQQQQVKKGGEDEQVKQKDHSKLHNRNKITPDGPTVCPKDAGNPLRESTKYPLTLEGKLHNSAWQAMPPQRATSLPSSAHADQIPLSNLKSDDLGQPKVMPTPKPFEPLVPCLLEEQVRATMRGLTGSDACLTSGILSPPRGARFESTLLSPPPKHSSGRVAFGLCHYEPRGDLEESHAECATSKNTLLQTGLPRLCSGMMSGSVDRRERDKMLKRQGSLAMFLPIPLVIERSTATPTKAGSSENFVQLVQNLDEGSSSSVSLPPTPKPGASIPRTQTFETASVLAATRENRKSSFSSLYFSMTKNCGRQWLLPSTSVQSQVLLDDDTNREVRYSSTQDDFMETAEGDSLTDLRLTIGVVETEEHVFLPRYELLDGGQTAMEVMLSSICAAGGSLGDRRAKWCNPPGSVDGPMAHDSKKYNTGGLPGDSDDNSEVFTFGSISPAYPTDPMDENPLVDCKVASRLLFDAEKGVVLISAQEEVGKYMQHYLPSSGGNDAKADERGEQQDGRDGNKTGKEEEEEHVDASQCTCCMQLIKKHACGMDYSNCHAHELYHHCMYCNRRPAAFLCLQCMKATCPSHVTSHYMERESECTLFLNLLDIMTSFDRIFWCEKCRCFTWRHTGVYDLLVDQLAITRGTYLQEAVRDISCVGYDVQLKTSPAPKFFSSFHTSSPRERGFCYSYSCSASPLAQPLLVGDTALSPTHFPLDSVRDRVPENNSSHHYNVERGSLTVCHSGSPMAYGLQRDLAGLMYETEVLCVGEAVPRLVSLGAKVQGWRTTQEDAEAAFVIHIPAPSSSSSSLLRPLTSVTADATAEGVAAAASGDVPPDTIAMAVFCVFDGHGGDAVAKLAATHFEAHLRKAVASGRHDDVPARALLFQLDVESSPPAHSMSEGSPSAAREGLFGRKPSQCESSNMDDDVPEGIFTTAALRRHVERTTESSKTRPGAGDVLGEAHSAAFPASGAAAQPDNTTTAVPASPSSVAWLRGNVSPIVSRQEMEMLRAYFASIMEDALLSLDDYLRQSPEGRRGDYNCTGCTACIVAITTNFILCANVGDSGAAFYTPRGIKRISVTHRTTNPIEEARIRAAGYSISGNRIEGLLAVPRALGDYDFKQCGGRDPREQAVTAVPDVTIMPVPSLYETTRWGIIVACDGVWDTATLHQVHHAIVNTTNDMDVAGSAMEVVLRAKEMEAALRHKIPTPPGTSPHSMIATDTPSLDALLLTSAAGIFAQCVAPHDNDEGIGMDNCSIFLIERR